MFGLTRDALRDAQVRVYPRVAADGAGAMALLNRSGDHADALRPDLIWLDLNLPEKDGRRS
jgi:two-component system, chemotaxis family, response regulator Rcp1